MTECERMEHDKNEFFEERDKMLSE